MPGRFRHKALRRANAFVTTHSPLGSFFIPVGKSCPILALARDFNVPTLCVAVAASLFQRINAAPNLPDVTSIFEMEIRDAFSQAASMAFVVHENSNCLTFQAPEPHDPHAGMVVCTYIMCLNLAVKFIHMPRAYSYPAKFLHPRHPQQCHSHLNAMLASVFGHDFVLTTQEVMAAELWIMRALDFNIIRCKPDPPEIDPPKPSSRSPTSVLSPMRA